MTFYEDVVPACRCEAHPPGTDKRRWMEVVQQTPDHVTWMCRRCSEICGFPVIQVTVLGKGREKARYLASLQRKHGKI